MPQPVSLDCPICGGVDTGPGLRDAGHLGSNGGGQREQRG